MWLTGLPVPVVPSPKFHANVYGLVPPLVVAVNVTGEPTVNVEEVKSLVRANGLIVTVAEAVAVAVFASVAVTEIVLLPFVE